MDLIHFVQAYILYIYIIYIRRIQSNYQEAWRGNPLIPAQEFAPTDRLIPTKSLPILVAD